MELLSENRSFGGRQQVYRHPSNTCGCEMTFAAYLPPQAEDGPVPVLWYLSGLTCTHENAMTKGGFQQHAAEHGLALIFPDTSPRGDTVSDDEAYDLGKGAGFYVNATRDPWKSHYRMYDYVVHELPAFVERHFPVIAGNRSISGHSMGGHGALVAALNEPERYRAVSAFAPISAPMRVPWGEKAFAGYLGEDREPVEDAPRLVADPATTEAATRWASSRIFSSRVRSDGNESQAMVDSFPSACNVHGFAAAGPLPGSPTALDEFPVCATYTNRSAAARFSTQALCDRAVRAGAGLRVGRIVRRVLAAEVLEIVRSDIALSHMANRNHRHCIAFDVVNDSMARLRTDSKQNSPDDVCEFSIFPCLGMSFGVACQALKRCFKPSIPACGLIGRSMLRPPQGRIGRFQFSLCGDDNPVFHESSPILLRIVANASSSGTTRPASMSSKPLRIASTDSASSRRASHSASRSPIESASPLAIRVRAKLAKLSMSWGVTI